MQRVFVTGHGIVSALGCGSSTFWDALKRGESGCRVLDLPNVDEVSVRVGAQVSSASCPSRLSEKERARVSRVADFVVETAGQAFDSAGLDSADVPDTGVFLGTSMGGFACAEEHFKTYFEQRQVSAMSVLRGMNSAPAAHASIHFGLTGPALTYDTACSSANHAIGNAFLHIRHGRLDRALAGGADSPFTPAVYAAWCRLPVLSRTCDPPAAACRPFSSCRTGTVLGEGAGMLLLESERAMRERGAEPLAEVIGYGASADAHHITKASARGPAAALAAALTDAGIGPEDVGFVSAHGTGTRVNDDMEGILLRECFGHMTTPPAVAATKGGTGHVLGGAAGLEAVVVVMALAEGLSPPSTNCPRPEPSIAPMLTRDGPHPLARRVAVSNSFGFGGNNAVIAMRRP